TSIRRAELVADHLDADDVAAGVADDAVGGDHVLDLDAFDLGFVQLVFLDWDLLDGTAIGHDRTFRAHAQHGADAVHRGEPTANGHDILADPDVFLAQVDIFQESDAGDDAGQVLTGDADLLGDLATGRDEDHIVLIDQVHEWNVFADLGIEMNVDSQI